MTEFYSCYYEKDIELTDREQEILFRIYKEVAEDQNFEPEISEPEEISDGSTFDHVAYHVENFGDDYPGYGKIKYLFE